MAFIRRHLVVVFFLLTYLISWGAWLGVNASGQALSGWLGLAALLGAFGPSLAGLVCAALLGRPALAGLLRRVIAWRVHGAVYLAVLIGPLALAAAPLALNTLLGGPAPRWAELLRLPELLPTALRMLLIGGLTEEIGWRGFALPLLRRQKGPLSASLLVGLAWGVSHLPIYSLPSLGSPLPPGDLAWFLFTTLLLSIFFTALAERSADSVLIAMLFHAWMNTAIPELPGLLGVPETDQLRVLTQLVWLFLAGLITLHWLRPARSPAKAAEGTRPAGTR